MFNRPRRFNDAIAQQRPNGEGGKLRVVLDPDHGAPIGVARGAGLPVVDSTGTRPTSLNAFADFSRSGTAADAAFWKIGTSLFRASAPQVLRDVRNEFSVSDGAEAWSVDVLNRVSARLQVYNAAQTDTANRVQLPPMLSDGNDLTADWLGITLWLTYGPATEFGTRRYTDLVLPRTVRVPRLGGAAWPTATGSAKQSVTFATSALSPDPFVERMSGWDFNSPGGVTKWSRPAMLVTGVALLYVVTS